MLDLTKFGKRSDKDKGLEDLTENSKTKTTHLSTQGCYYNELKPEPQTAIKNHNKPSKSSCKENNEQLYIKSRKNQ